MSGSPLSSSSPSSSSSPLPVLPPRSLGSLLSSESVLSNFHSSILQFDSIQSTRPAAWFRWALRRSDPLLLNFFLPNCSFSSFSCHVLLHLPSVCASPKVSKLLCDPSSANHLLDPLALNPTVVFFFFFSSFLSSFHFFLLLIRISGFQYQKDLPPFFILIFLGLSPSPDLAAPGAVSPIHLIPVLTTISIHLAILHLPSTGFPRLASLISARPASRLAIFTRPTIAPWTLFRSCCLCGLRSDAAKLLRSRVAESSNPPVRNRIRVNVGRFPRGRYRHCISRTILATASELHGRFSPHQTRRFYLTELPADFEPISIPAFDLLALPIRGT